METSVSKSAATPVRRALKAPEIVAKLSQLTGWSLRGDGADLAITKTWNFTNFHETMAFVNAVAFVAHGLDHHPDLGVHYSRCVVSLRTHDVGGLSAADFDFAARVEALLS
jgi:4a-hydroxytetrahydrobiopterin dehydratase